MDSLLPDLNSNSLAPKGSHGLLLPVMKVKMMALLMEIITTMMELGNVERF